MFIKSIFCLLFCRPRRCHNEIQKSDSSNSQMTFVLFVVLTDAFSCIINCEVKITPQRKQNLGSRVKTSISRELQALNKDWPQDLHRNSKNLNSSEQLQKIRPSGRHFNRKRYWRRPKSIHCPSSVFSN